MINTAAASVPAWCEQHQDAARAINVPTQLLTTLQRRGGSALLIHISTDQVYSGNDPPQGGWRETDAPAPINTYGRTKLEAEQAVMVDWEGSRSWVGSASMAGRTGKDQGPLSYGPSLPTAQAGWSNHVILRPSIIVGPEPPQPIDRPLFLSQILRSFAQQVGRGAGSKAYFVSGLLRCNALAQSQDARPNRSLLRRFCRGKGPISQTSGGRRWRWQTFAGRAWS